LEVPLLGGEITSCKMCSNKERLRHFYQLL